MPLSRSPRMDRRRRAIREGLAASIGQSDEARVSPSRTARPGIDLPELTKKERGVAYSHSVRQTCQHRLVQFIPVRKLSLTGAIAGSIAVPLILLTLHYLVFVSGTLAWSRHPMSALLDAASPRSLAAWLASHLWLLCLAATVLTFRLRKHKLDDYEGEYRLWFWLVFTCVIGSIDSTTRLTELFGAALDRWSQLHVGWTGGAIVQATLATLIGMLGLRLCSELKTVPASLVLWLVGLVCWAGSAALSQSLLRIDITVPTREWLRASLWLSGLTSIWLSGLLFLRAVFMEAQQRFLARTALAAGNAVPWRERLKEAMPKLPRFGRKAEEDEASEEELAATTKRRKKTAAAARADQDADDAEDRTAESNTEKAPKRRWGFGGLALRPPAATSAEAASSKETGARKSRSRDERDDDDEELDSSADNRSRSRDSNDSDESAIEQEYGKRPGWFRRRAKPTADEANDRTDNRRDHRGNNRDDDSDDDSATGDQKKRSRFAAKLFARKKSAADREQLREDDAQDAPAAEKRSLRDRMRLKRKPRDEGDEEKPVKQKAKPAARGDDSGDSADGEAKRSWLRKPSLPKVSIPKPRMPKLKLPSFRLPPPDASAEGEGDNEGQAKRVPSANTSRPLPSTSANYKSQPQDEDADSTRGLSKAERKRLKRMQRDDDNDRRAA